MTDEFVTAQSTRTGKKRRIPAHWLENPTFSKDWKLPPSAKKKAEQDSAPTDVVVPPVGDVDAPPTSATPGDTDTPAAGGEQEN